MKPWHERFPPWGWLRRRLRNAYFGFLGRTAATDDARDLAAETLRGLLAGRPLDVENAPSPYPELGAAEPAYDGTGVVFISGRFRSGSTLLWNLFRNAEGFTSYYEPLNERRWFEPSARGQRIDPTHRGVSDYWREYDGLEELGQFYREDWIRRHLYMDERHWEPDLLAFLRLLCRRAAGRPVLQFNRMDFRLPWLRHHFPAARIVHLYRHPRDQWCSHIQDPKSFPQDGRVADFGPHDHFYLLHWVTDLKHHFPFLDPVRASHPYQLYYYVWKLSYLFGRQYAHYSIGFEELGCEPGRCLRELLEAVDADPERQDLKKLQSLIAMPALGKWKVYADDDWFRRHETHCEAVLADFLGGAVVPEAAGTVP